MIGASAAALSSVGKTYCAAGNGQFQKQKASRLSWGRAAAARSREQPLVLPIIYELLRTCAVGTKRQDGLLTWAALGNRLGGWTRFIVSIPGAVNNMRPSQ
ncbi:hypothetical protein CCM_03145 [Cordyceps militaris CM01]|uniref:Uncharacterized protein n=1 Tax=Cordyceps militaris (strain CM01) TaxID=983644 RepID=G3J945_CORMM|nr:uncharacterized protein CCM_03145 [Cordyceps militaris CM01]EGX94874.1 hypothetical protein CCM_03145 [Cordyceps militaris CM01]